MHSPDNRPAPSLGRLLARTAVKLAVAAAVFALIVGALGWWWMGLLAGLGNGNGARGE